MMNKLCNGIETKNGKMLCAVLTTVGGLHLALTESQPVLGMLDLPSFRLVQCSTHSWFGPRRLWRLLSYELYEVSVIKYGY